LLGRQLLGLFWRHGRPDIRTSLGRQDQRALARLSRRERGFIGIAAAKKRGSRPQIEAAFDLLRIAAVTRDALALEQRRDATDEKRLGIGLRVRLLRGGGDTAGETSKNRDEDPSKGHTATIDERARRDGETRW